MGQQDAKGWVSSMCSSLHADSSLELWSNFLELPFAPVLLGFPALRHSVIWQQLSGVDAMWNSVQNLACK